MSRREILTAVELAMTASALTAGTYGLVRASYDPYAAVEWVPIVAIGLGTAAAFAVVAAALFVGRAALLLAADAVGKRAREQAPPPSASAPLWQPRPADEQAIDAYASPGTGRRGLPPMVGFSAEEIRKLWHEAVGGGR